MWANHITGWRFKAYLPSMWLADLRPNVDESHYWLEVITTPKENLNAKKTEKDKER